MITLAWWWVVGAVPLLLLGLLAFCAIVAGWRDDRRGRAISRNAVFHLWCKRHHWCPAHDRADGECPPLVRRNPHGRVTGVGLCAGSEAIEYHSKLYPKIE